MEFLLILLIYLLALKYLGVYGFKKPVTALFVCTAASFSLVAGVVYSAIV